MSKETAASESVTSARAASKPQKSKRELELEVRLSEVEDERDTLRGQLSEMEKAIAPRRTPPAKPARREAAAADDDETPPPRPTPPAPGMDWEGFVKAL